MTAHRPRVAWVTNDLPPRTGGIQQFVANLLERTTDATTLVVGPAAPVGTRRAADAFDASGPWVTVRAPGPILPRAATSRWVVEQLVAHRPDVVVIASLWPLGRLASALRSATGAPILGLTHGAEAGLARGPGRVLLRSITRDVDRITVISDHTANAIGGALRGRRLDRLAPGVDPERYLQGSEGTGGDVMRTRWGVPTDAIVVGCVARLVRRKGQDVLLRAWEAIERRHPSAHLVLVGEGPLRRTLERTASQLPSAHVVGPVSSEDLPAAYAAFDVFAMPVRTRLAGLDVEGLGISFLEAQAAGLPVIAGRSGGAPETVADDRVGTVVDGRDVRAVVEAISGWIDDRHGREAVQRLGPRHAASWSWAEVAQRFDLLIGDMTGRASGG